MAEREREGWREGGRERDRVGGRAVLLATMNDSAAA